MRLKILNYYPLFLPFKGGIETNIYTFAKHSKHKHCILTDMFPGTSENEKIGTCTVIRARPSRIRIPEGISPLDAFLDLPRELVKTLALRDLKYDIFHLRCSYTSPRVFISLDNRIGISLFKKLGAWHASNQPVIATFHGVPSHDSPGKINKSWLGTEADICKHAARIICVDEYMVAPLRQLSDGKEVFHIPSGVDTSLFRPIEYRQCMGNLPPVVQSKVDDDKFKVLYVGRIDPNKGISLLRSLSRKLPRHVKLVVAGGGNPALLANAKNISTIGGLPNRLVPYLINVCDVAINLTQWAGSGRFSFEALACGKPVIRLWTGKGYPLEHLKNVIFVDGIEEGLEWIKELHRNESLYRELGKHALQTRKAISVKTLAKEIDRIYEDVYESYITRG